MALKLWRQRQPGRRRSWRLLPEVVAIGAIVMVRLSGGLQFLEWAAFDLALRLRPAEPSDQRVVVVGIREEDIRGTGKFPIPDGTLAELINTLQTYQPAAIGLDIFRDLPVEPGHQALLKTFQASQNLIVVEKVLPDQSGFTVNTPPGISSQQVGFADAFFDEDGKLRRSLLGTLSNAGDYRLSLSLRLAALYLNRKGYTLENGIRDRETMRFGLTELPRVHPNTGGYVRADTGGNQMLINFRSGRQPFRILTLREIQSGVNPAWLRDRIILVGYTAPSVKDVVSSAAIDSDNPALIYGVEVQAHVISQIISGVLDGRPLLQSWPDGWEYLWIIGWGVVGLAIGRLIRLPLVNVTGLAIASVGLIGGSYVLILLGWWVPVVPAFLALVINGAGLAAFYRYDEALRSRIQERQQIIDQTFDAIHNGPLQTLATLLRQTQETPSWQPLTAQLQVLNQELRQVYEVVRREAMPDAMSAAAMPLHEALHQVYNTVIQREFPGFKTIHIKVLKFEPIADQHLSQTQRQGLCRFLEEALCNIGKHAVNATRLEVTCMQTETGNLIRVVDNGKSSSAKPKQPAHPVASGYGTQQAQKLAQQLGGQFRRSRRDPQGMICELTWCDRRSRLNQFWHT
ncbi:MAG: CHASE2 domain-containing protein [Leptolyngbyaceae cyanobacterium bins.349]|nr:CHASE2 domain-containing protein [Leptolyngbyaceae cyanobacterium bins.349]